MKQIELFGLKIRAKWLWLAGGILIGIPVLVIVALAILGPVFGGASASLRSGGYGDGAIFSGAPAYDDYARGGGEFAAEEPAAFAPLATQVAPEGNTTNGVLVQVTERLIIREGNLNMDVQDTLAARDQIEILVDEYALQGAFVVSSNEYGNTSGSPNISMTIRVPASQFDPIMDRLAALAVIVNTRNETASDVTEEYVDLQGRLEALETGRDRLLDIMENADTTEALLQAEYQLTVREAEIESIQGRLQYLRGAATLSRISITLNPHFASQPIDTTWKPFESLRRGLDDLLDSLRDFVDWLLYFIVAGLPWLVVVFLLVRWGWRALVRRQQRNAAEKPPEQK